MQLRYLSPWWGHEQVPMKVFLPGITAAGYDGIDTWMPAGAEDRKALRESDVALVLHQHEATDAADFKRRLEALAAWRPLLINSHTGRDWFTADQHLALIDIAQEVAEKTGIPIVHETHRGRMGYSPQTAAVLFDKRPALKVTADFSHWTCVTESMLDNFSDTVTVACRRARHIHARVGFEQGPQVSDPADPKWAYALNAFLLWWDAIVAHNRFIGTPTLTITTEFGPPPYMPCEGSQTSQNKYMLDLLKTRYGTEMSKSATDLSHT